MKSNKSNAKIRIIPIFLILAVIFSITISSEIEKKIEVRLDFSNSTNYDINNDGAESTKGIVDLSVDKTTFTWDLEKEKLATKWSITNMDDNTITTICYGNEEACSFINLVSSSENWDDILYVNYKKDGAGLNNKVSAQVIYYDVNLTVPFSEIYYSSEPEKVVKFYEKDPTVISNLDVKIKNKEGTDIGHYEIQENEGGYDLIISNKKEERNKFRALSKNSDTESESKTIIKNIQQVDDIKAIIDQTDEEKIKTDIIAVDDTNLLFETAEVTLTKRGDVNRILRCENFNFEKFECDNWQETEIQFVDDGTTVRFNVTGFSAYAGAEISIINVHSYPPLYGNWVVMFNTTGTDNLTIRAINGTTWTETEDVGSGYDLRFLEIKCGETVLSYEWKDDSVFIENYSCSELGYATQKELTSGKHYLEFGFGSSKAYAYNSVGLISLSAASMYPTQTITATSSGVSAWYSNNTAVCSISSYSSTSATITGVATGTCYVNATDGYGNWSTSQTITVSANNIPYVYNISIRKLDETDVSNGGQAYASDDLKCVVWAHDNDYESLTIYYNITILETYNRGSTTIKSGSTSACLYFSENSAGFQGGLYNAQRGDTYCVIFINSSEVSKGDKIECAAKAYDYKQYGASNTSGKAYINNTRPFASQVYISPAEPNQSATLTCNYTFNDVDCAGGVCDTENTSAPLFKWYINNEGLNDFIEIPNETSKTLSSYFDKDDVLMCSVKVKDLETGWLNNPLYDDGYVNSSNTTTIKDNAAPQIISFNDSSNQTNPTTEDQSVVFSATWVDYEDPGEISQIYVCSSNKGSDLPDEKGTSNLTIGAGNSTILYTNLTGQYVETIAIKPNAYIDSAGTLYSTNTSTAFLYDVYAFEVDNVGDPIPTFDESNMSTYPIAEDHNNAFINGRWNYIKLQYNSQPLVGKRLAIVFCIDDNDDKDNHVYCGSDISTGPETVYIRATSTTTNSNVNITNRTGYNVGSYTNSSILINYKSVSNGNTSSTGCIGTEYCHTSLSSAETLSCSYNVKSTDPQQANTYYIRACDDGGLCSVWRQGDFWVNYKAQMNEFNITTIGKVSAIYNYSMSSTVSTNDKDIGIALIGFLTSEKFVISGNNVFNSTNDIYSDVGDDNIADPTDTMLKNNTDLSNISTNATVTGVKAGPFGTEHNYTLNLTYTKVGSTQNCLVTLSKNLTNATITGTKTGPFNTSTNYSLSIIYTKNGITENCNVTLNWSDYTSTDTIVANITSQCNLSAGNVSGKLNLTTFGAGSDEYINITGGNVTGILGLTVGTTYYGKDNITTSSIINDINLSCNLSVTKTGENITLTTIGYGTDEYINITGGNATNILGFSVGIYNGTNGSTLSNNWLKVKHTGNAPYTSYYYIYNDTDNSGDISVGDIRYSNVNISVSSTGNNFTDDSNLNCSHNSGTDTWNKTALTFTYKWYLDRGTGVFAPYTTSPDAQVLSHANTNIRDRWLCEVTPNDGFGDGTPRNSSNIAYIGINPVNGYNANGTPFILNVTDNSDSEAPTPEGSAITFLINWSDSNSTSLSKVFICNSTSVTTTGCLDNQFAEAGPTSSNPVSLSFTVLSSWPESWNASIFVYDDTWIRSSVYTEPFWINHKPNATVSIKYIDQSTLNCSYSYTDSDGDPENTSLTKFRWWQNGILLGLETGHNLTPDAVIGNNFTCGVMLYDSHNLSSSDYINSSMLQGTDIIMPVLWNLPEVIKYEENKKLSITGYINKSDLNVSTAAIQGDLAPFTNWTNSTLGISELITTKIVRNSSASGLNYIWVDHGDRTYFEGKNISFEHHNGTNFLRYSVLSVENYVIRDKITISPNLSAAVSALEEVYIYSYREPTGWFNISIQLHNGTNTVYVWGQNTTDNAEIRGPETTFTIFYDNESPYINISDIGSSSNQNSHNISFKVTDNYKINLSTLLINITNYTGNYNVTHRYDSLFYNNSNWNWGSNITCSGNNTNKDCTVLLNLPNGNYSLNLSVIDLAGNGYNLTIKDYTVDSSVPLAPTVYVKSIQNITNLSVLWRDSYTNITGVQYAVGENRTGAGYDSVIAWTNVTENPKTRIIDSNNDYYPDTTEAIFQSTNYMLDSSDTVNRTGYAALKNFLNGTEMANCSNLSFISNCSIVYNVDSDSKYNYSLGDRILYGSSSMQNGTTIVNITTSFWYSDSDHDSSYDSGEAVIESSNSTLEQGNLNGSGVDIVLINATLTQLYSYITTSSLSLENHHFYYVSVQYKADTNLFYSSIGASLSIKYKTSSGGGGTDNGSTDCTGPTAVAVTAPLISEVRTLNASWTASTDNCYNIGRYEYALGTEKYNTTNWNSTLGWTNSSSNRTAFATAQLVDGEAYYWSVRAINSIGQESAVNSSDGTTYYDQIAPVVSSWNISDGTNSSGTWLDNANDSSTLFYVFGDENMTCFISPYDKGYTSYSSSSDKMCNASTNPARNLSCNVTDLAQGSYSYHIVCQDTSSPTPNKQTSENNKDITFSVNWYDSPTINNFSIWVYYQNMTMRGEASSISNTTFTNDVLICNGTYYDLDGNSLVTGTLQWKINNSVIKTTTISQTNITSRLDLSSAGYGSKSDNISCMYNLTDNGPSNNQSTSAYNVTVNNSRPILVSDPTISSNASLNRTNESLNCYAPAVTDLDNDTTNNYTYKWYKNGTLNLTSNTNLASDTLGHGNTSKNERWLCEVVPSDGQDNGTSRSSPNLTIQNSAPYNNGTIPTISWGKGTSTTMNISNYFKDVDADSLIYNSTTAENITVVIDQTTGIVTFSTSDSSFSGTRTIKFNATDRTDWSSYSNDVTLNVTNVVMTVSLIIPINNYNLSASNLFFNCSVNNSIGNNLTNATLKIYNGTGLIYTKTNTTIPQGSLSNSTFNVTNLNDSTYTWNCYFVDNQSNEGYATSSYTLTIDTTPPTLNFSTGTAANYSNVSRIWIYADVTATESLRNVSFNLYNTSNDNHINSTNYTTSTRFINWTNLVESNYSYNITGCDYSGNCNYTITRTIRIDLTQPKGAGSLTNTSINESSVTLNWTLATDTITGVKEYYIYRNGTLINNTTNLNYTDSNLNASTSYLYNVSAIDYAGNENKTVSLEVITTSDTTAPLFTVVSSSVTSSSATITWTTDDLTNATISYGTTVNLGTSTNYSSYATSHSLTLSGLSASTTYYYNITAQNTPGLNATNGTNTFTTSSGGSGSTSGGGGGGGSSSTGTTNKIGLSSSFSGYNLKKNDILEFAFKNTTYSLKISQVTSTYLELSVTQTSYKFKMNVGETKQVDLNGDGKNDIELNLVSINSQNIANLLIRTIGEPKALAIIPTKTKETGPVEETGLQPAEPQQPALVVQGTTKKKDKTDVIAYAIAALIALAIIGSLFMKEKMKVDYMYSQPELRLHDFIIKAKSKGHHINDIRKALISNGWPSHIVDAVSLHGTIDGLVSGGHNHKTIKDHLKKKGFNNKIINDAMLHHYITTELHNRKSIKDIRAELLEAGWDKKIVDKKLPAK